MQTDFDPIGLAHAIAEIACRTQEHETARRLVEPVDRLLTVAGLPQPAQESPPTREAKRLAMPGFRSAFSCVLLLAAAIEGFAIILAGWDADLQFGQQSGLP